LWRIDAWADGTLTTCLAGFAAAPVTASLAVTDRAGIPASPPPSLPLP
jgi:hypothetical protein